MGRGNKTDGVDLVYLWVDGQDPEWLEKRRRATHLEFDETETNSKARYVSNQELKYSLRSAEKHLPWLRKIFIVTDDQKPSWLNEAHPQVQIVDHSGIMPEDILPCFNSTVIEYFLYRIPNLSEYFLFANDDMFFARPLSKNFFFGDDDLPIVRLKRKPLGKWHLKIKKMKGKKIGQYRDKVEKGARLVEQKVGQYYSGVPHHNVDAYLKSDYGRAVERVFDRQVKESMIHQTRVYGDLHRSVFSLYALAKQRAHLKYVGRKESLRIPIYKRDYWQYMEKYNPSLLCMNDDQMANNEDRKRLRAFLSGLFPEKSAFEL